MLYYNSKQLCRVKAGTPFMKGGDALSTYEAISLMILFAMLVIAIINISQKKTKK